MTKSSQNTETETRICLGKITQPHGVKGLVKVMCYADDPQLLHDRPLFTSETGQNTITLNMKNSMGKYWLAAADNITSRDDADTLRQTKLWVTKDILPDIDDEDEYYIEDLIGMKVKTENGDDAGVVLALQNYGAGDLLEIKPPANESYYLPFTKECVPHIDSATGEVTIAPPTDLEGSEE